MRRISLTFRAVCTPEGQFNFWQNRRQFGYCSTKPGYLQYLKCLGMVKRRALVNKRTKACDRNCPPVLPCGYNGNLPALHAVQSAIRLIAQ